MNALLRIVGWVLAVALVVLPVVAVLNGWVGAGHWPLTRLQATGEFHRVDGVLLRQTLLPYAQRGVHRPATSGSVVSKMRQHSSSKPMPACFAAMGTSEWLVMPGAVFTSSR